MVMRRSKNVFERLFEDGVTPDQRRHQADNAYPVEGLPEMKPDRRSGERDKDYAKHLDKFKAMFVVFFRRDVGEGIRRFGKVNSGFGYFAQISLCFLLVHNGHSALRTSS